MKKVLPFVVLSFVCFSVWSTRAVAQEKKLEHIRIGGGAVGAAQMTMWFAKEANLYEKYGLAVEAIHIPGSSLALQAMLSGELPIIQLGGPASIQANFAGADTVIVATILKKFLFSIFSRPEITSFAGLKGELFGATRFGTLSDFAARFALEKNGLDPDRDVTMVQTGGGGSFRPAKGPGKNTTQGAHGKTRGFYRCEFGSRARSERIIAGL